MRYRWEKLGIYLIWLTILLITSITITSCFGGNPGVEITVANQSNQVLYITTFGENKAVSPGGQITIYGSKNTYYIIRAKNSQGEIVFNKEYTHQELQKTGFKVIIPPFSDNSTNSENASSK